MSTNDEQSSRLESVLEEARVILDEPQEGLPILLKDKGLGLLDICLSVFSGFAGLIGLGLWVQYLQLHGDIQTPWVNTISGSVLVTIFPVYTIVRTCISNQTTVDRDRVTRQWFFRKRPVRGWTEPIANYKGLEYGTGGNPNTLEKHHYVNLVHPKPGRSVSLWSSSSEDVVVSEICESYARLLGVGLLEQVDGEPYKRQPEDIGKTVWELIDEGKLEVDQAGRSSPPPGMEMAIRGGTEVVTAPANKSAYLSLAIWWIIPLGVLGMFCYGLLTGMMAKEAAVALAPIILLFVVALLVAPVAVYWGQLRRFRLEVGQESVRFGYAKRNDTLKVKKKVRLSSIKNIDFTPQGAVHFSVRGGQTVGTRPLGKACGKWLASYILARGAERG